MDRIRRLFDNKKLIRIVTVIWAALLIILHFTRIFDNNFWGDEYYSIHLIRMPLGKMLVATAHDTHPPFYYLISKLFVAVLGDSGWVYHLMSFIPFVLMVIACLTIVRIDFGEWASLTLVTLCGTLYQATHFMVEVRDYEWAALFLLLAFVYCRRILDYETDIDSLKTNLTFFVAFSLLAAYSDYFCIFALIVIYVGLMVFAIKHKVILSNIITTWGITFLLYLPWGLVFLSTFSSNKGKFFKAESISFLECLKFMLASKFTYILLVVFILTSIYLLLKEKNTPVRIWLLIGMIAVLMTILVPMIIGRLGTPLLYLRHLYPVSAIVWILLSSNITRVPYNKALVVIILAITMPFGLLGVKSVIQEEHIVNKKLDAFLESTNEIKPENDNIIISNEDIISPGLAEYYYPGVSNYLYDQTEENNSLIKENAATVIWLIDAVNCPNGVEMREYCESLGYSCERIVENGFFGNYTADAWRCVLVD